MPSREYHDRPQDSVSMSLLQQLDHLQASAPRPAIEPPDLVDQAVRNLARRELHARAPSPVAGKLRWIAGLATVSVALLAIGLSLVQSPQLPPAAGPQLREELRQLESAPVAAAPPAGETQARSGLRAERAAANPPVPAAGPAEIRKLTDAPEAMAREKAAPDQLDEAAATPVSHASELPAADAGTDPARAWLDLAEQLYQRGLLAEAAEQLDALVAEFPDYPLPEWAEQLREDYP